MSAVFDPNAAAALDRLDQAERRALQLERLQATIERVLQAQPALSGRLVEAGIASPKDCSSLDKLEKIPFATKGDLRANYPFGLLAVAREELVRVHASSGTYGKATVVGYTRNDLDNWTELMARSMWIAGVRPGMLVHNANNYGLFTGGFGFHQGAEHLGATIVPCSGGRTTRQATLLRDFGAQVLVATPSYALSIGQAADEAGIGVGELSLELGLFGGEPWSEAMRSEVEAALGIRAVNFYGLSELCGPGVAVECEQRCGLHLHEDHFLVEVIDPSDGRVLSRGEEGELVFSTLTKEAMPLVRYRTGDIGTVLDEPCACGRTTVRLSGLRGRHDDVVIVRGVNVHPSEIEHVLLSVPGVAPHYRLVIDRPGALDELTVECEPAEPSRDSSLLIAELAGAFHEHIGLRVAVALGEPGSVPRSEGKAVRVLDRRAPS